MLYEVHTTTVSCCFCLCLPTKKKSIPLSILATVGFYGITFVLCYGAVLWLIDSVPVWMMSGSYSQAFLLCNSGSEAGNGCNICLVALVCACMYTGVRCTWQQPDGFMTYYWISSL